VKSKAAVAGSTSFGVEFGRSSWAHGCRDGGFGGVFVLMISQEGGRLVGRMGASWEGADVGGCVFGDFSGVLRSFTPKSPGAAPARAGLCSTAFILPIPPRASGFRFP
jgi:hypothetical protein